MKRKIITTEDGSKTIHIEDWNEQYHSIHGAIQEANHVFIKHGLHHYHQIHNSEEISILEIGFGTGLNAFLTCLDSELLNKMISYVGIEAFPVSKDEIEQLNYADLIAPQQKEMFNKLHHLVWEKQHQITHNFKLMKHQKFFSELKDVACFDLIYYDAFGARVQPELWTVPIFEIMYDALKPSGVLVTYSAKGSARRAMETVGFNVERLQGPPGKRHMLRATK